jgi:mannose-6-phosphate isomerase-like protein (cupin superfamily)
MAWIDIADQVHFSDEKLAKVGLCESPRMMFDVYCAQPGQQQKPHVHGDVDKVYVVLSGTPTVILDGEERVLGPQQAAYAAAGVVHGVRNDGAQPATLLVFQARTPK